MFPKIDIAKEREEREIFAAGTAASSSSMGPTIHVVAGSNSPPIIKSSLKVNQNSIGKHSPSEAREVAQDKDNRCVHHSAAVLGVPFFVVGQLLVVSITVDQHWCCRCFI